MDVSYTKVGNFFQADRFDWRIFIMKQILLLAVAAFSAAQLAVAGACTPGTLTSYVALGATGCTIGADTLSNFQILPGTVTELAGGLVNISTMGGVYNPGLTISISQSATGGNALETMFTYDISGPLQYTGISSVLGGSSETTINDGVTGIVNFCEGGSFGPDGVDGCTHPNGSLLTLSAFDPTLNQNSDMASIGKQGFVNVTDDFMLDSGGGTASGGTLTNSFTAVPEPVSTALAGLGLVLAGALKVRSTRAKQESK
jgi:hypothetical protein